MEQQLSYWSEVLFVLWYDITPTVRPTLQSPWGWVGGLVGSQPSQCPYGLPRAPESKVDSGAARPGNWSPARYPAQWTVSKKNQIKHDHHTQRNTDWDLHWAFLAFCCSPSKACVWVHLAWQCDAWQLVTLSVTLGLRVGVMGARGVGGYFTCSHTHRWKAEHSRFSVSPTEPGDNKDDNISILSWPSSLAISSAD